MNLIIADLKHLIFKEFSHFLKDFSFFLYFCFWKRGREGERKGEKH